MKVDIANLWSSVDAVQPSSVAARHNISGGETPAPGTDDARLSETAVVAGRLHQQLGAVSDTRQERVEALRQQVSKATYSVSADQIATALHSVLAALNRALRGRS